VSHPLVIIGGVSALEFAVLARRLADEARRLGLVPPAFRSPPGVDGPRRAVRRHRGRGATVVVRREGRPAAAVAADMAEGVVVANSLTGCRASVCRSALAAVVDGGGHEEPLGVAG
jgi:hypothetical protein